MPTIAIIGPYRFSFFSGDRHERPHVHVWRERAEAKFWLNPVSQAYNKNFSTRELRRIENIVIENHKKWMELWNGYFGR